MASSIENGARDTHQESAGTEPCRFMNLAEQWRTRPESGGGNDQGEGDE